MHGCVSMTPEENNEKVKKSLTTLYVEQPGLYWNSINQGYEPKIQRKKSLKKQKPKNV